MRRLLPALALSTLVVAGASASALAVDTASSTSSDTPAVAASAAADGSLVDTSDASLDDGDSSWVDGAAGEAEPNAEPDDDAAPAAPPPPEGRTTLSGRHHTTVVTTPDPQHWVAGSRIVVWGGYEAVSIAPNTSPVLQGMRLLCSGAGSTSASVFSTTNNNGSASGTSKILGHTVFVVPKTGDYTCSVDGWATQDKADVPKDDSGKWPDLLAVVEGRDTFVSTDVVTLGANTWQGTTETVDLARGKSTTVLSHTWAPGSTARTVSFYADVELSNEGSATSTSTVVLDITQVAASGKTCSNHVAVSVKPSISWATHHAKQYLRKVGLPVSTASGCTRSFAVRVGVTNTAASTLRVYDKGYSNVVALGGSYSLDRPN